MIALLDLMLFTITVIFWRDFMFIERVYDKRNAGGLAKAREFILVGMAKRVQSAVASSARVQLRQLAILHPFSVHITRKK